MPDTGYGSPLFSRACRIAAACREIEGSGPRAAWRRVRAGSLILRWYQRRLPSIEIRPTTSPPGRMISQHFAIRDEGRRRYRRAQGVLALPDDFSEYMRGRHRQAVRTNVGHARKAGLTVISYAVDNWAPGEGDIRRPDIAPGPIERWMVLDAEGVVVADSIVSVDESVALLHGLVSFATNARWLLHTAIVERLCGSCAVLLTNSEDAYWLGSGTRHFQRLLGYRIMRLRLPHSNRSLVAEPTAHPAGLSWPPEQLEQLSWRILEPVAAEPAVVGSVPVAAKPVAQAT
jgi:hypothetical protein